MSSNHPKAILEPFGITPKKSLGQNFLYDPNILQKIADLAEIGSEDDVLEIGPGLGSLTKSLAKRARRIIAVELDQRLIPVLDAQLRDYPNVIVIQGDILKFELEKYFVSEFKVVSNVPYYITGAILRFLYSTTLHPRLVILTVQEEVAARLTAVAGDMSLLSCSVQYFAEPETCFTIKAGAFWPKPEVNSTVVRLRTRQTSLLRPSEQKLYFSLVQAGYSQKRKQIRKNLLRLGYTKPQLEQALSRSGVDGTQRAQELAVIDWVRLVEQLVIT